MSILSFGEAFRAHRIVDNAVKEVPNLHGRRKAISTFG
jgi:hypothetical protein